MTVYKNVLVAIDGSDISNKVIEVAHNFAPEAHIDILTVVDTTGGGYFGTIVMNSDIIYQLEQEAEEYINKAYKYAKALGHEDVDIHIRFGSPKQVISRGFIKDHHNDLIVVGETGMNRMQRAMSGTVPAFVTKTSEIDVLVARALDRD